MRNSAPVKVCTSDRCIRPQYARGKCRYHYELNRRRTVERAYQEIERLQLRIGALERREKRRARIDRLVVLICRHLGLLPSRLEADQILETLEAK